MKKCKSCTKCCEGWLSADIKGHKMYPGQPCYFLNINKGCKIYNDRPEDPCKTFNCSWIQIEEMPKKFKPDKSGVIMSLKINNGNQFLSIVKAPNNPDAEYISWALNYAKLHKYNLIWYIDDRYGWVGNKDFIKQMEEEHRGCLDCGEFHWNWSIEEIDPELIKKTKR